MCDSMWDEMCACVPQGAAPGSAALRLGGLMHPASVKGWTTACEVPLQSG
jgi:hypothetical protein